MTRIQEYYDDMGRVWSAIIVVASITLGLFVVVTSHLILGV